MSQQDGKTGSKDTYLHAVSQWNNELNWIKDTNLGNVLWDYKTVICEVFFYWTKTFK